MVNKAEKIFTDRFPEKPLVVRSPGRINLIGEHTDYNNGFVLPAAIDKAAYIAISKRSDDEVHLYAADLEESYTTTLKEISPQFHHWSSYLLGVVDQLQKKGTTLTGFNAVLSCDVPAGAGMSSSAAIECATLFSLNELFQLHLEKLEMVRIAQKAENEFAGVKCGIMDMFASIMGKQDHVMRLDCRDLSYQYFPLHLGDYKIVLFDTGVKHSLAGGEYNKRRQQCEEGVTLLQKKHPQVLSLRDVTPAMLDTGFKNLAGDTVYNRCKYVVEENNRLLEGCELLLKNDITGFGKKMFSTHEGLSKLYEVSCAESDLLVELAAKEAAIAGARMMGGGFGGCTINLVREADITTIYNRFAAIYLQDTGKELKMYETTPQDGASLCH